MTRFSPADPPPEGSPLGTSAEGEAAGDRPEEIAAGFPRHLTRNLLEEASVGERRRQALQVGLFVLALTLFALAQPHLRWIGRSLAWREWRLSNGPAGYVHHDILGGLLELGGFLLSALLAAATLPLFLRMGNRCGLSFGRALATAALGVLAPAAFVAARVPGVEARGLFASSLLFLLLLNTEQSTRRRIALVSAAAILLDPATIVLLPAVLSRHGWRRARWLLLFLIPAAFFGAPAALVPGLERSPFFALHGLTALGILLPFLAAPYLASRSDREEPPPSWLGLWIAGSLLSPFEGAPLLVAPAVFGLQDLLGRRQEAEAPPILQRAILPLLLLQVLGSISLDAWVRQSDPRRTWRRSAREVLQPYDAVLTDSVRSVHLLTVRGGEDTSVYWLPETPTGADWDRILEHLGRPNSGYVLDLSEERSGQLRDALPGLFSKNARRLRH